MQSGKLTPSQERRSYFCAFVFIVTMVAAASFWDDREIVLPEIAAMAVALFAYREQSWMRHPEKIFLWPTVTALLGFGINLLAIPFCIQVGAGPGRDAAVLFRVSLQPGSCPGDRLFAGSHQCDRTFFLLRPS